MEDHTVSTTNARWRWLALLAVFAMIVAACSSDTTDDTTDAGDDTETTTTTEAPATTAADDGDEPSAEGFTYNIAIFSDPQTSNPWAAIDTENDVWTSYVNPGGAALYTYQPPTYSVIPSMAADDAPPAVAPDGDNFSVTVALNEGQLWSDGEEINAQDVVFTFETVKKYDGLGGNFPALWPLAREDDPATEEDESSLGVLSVEAPDDYTVKITFNFDAGLAVWPFQVGLAPVYPEHFWGPIVDANDTFEGMYATDGLGSPQSGAFNTAEWEPGAFWRNVAVEDYFDAGSSYRVYSNGSVEYAFPDGTLESYGPPPEGDVVADYIEGPFADDVVYSLYSDQNSAVLALTDGEVDFLLNPLGLQRGLQQLVLAEPNLNVIVNEQLGYRYMSYNTRKFPMSEKSFRQAIACRIDKEFMANTVLGGSAIAANSQVPPGNAFWANPDLSAICDGQSEQERMESAVQILKDGGWTWDVEPVWNEDNRDVLPKGEGLRGPDGTLVQPLTLLAPGPGYDPLRATYSLFIEEWAVDLGIPLQAEPTGFSVIVDEVFATGEGALEWDMYILGWGLGPFPDYVFDFFESSADSADGGFNTPGYANPEFDALADEFRGVKTLEEARELVFAADAILAEDLPYVVLFTTPIIEAYRNSITFPFTTVLDGVQNFGGLATQARSTQ
jgi:ABC-type transport system substrate-binding protein